MADESKVEISLKEIYEEFRELSKNIQDLIIKVDNSKTIDDDHELRIRILERWKNAIPASIAATLVTLIVEIVRMTGK